MRFCILAAYRNAGILTVHGVIVTLIVINGARLEHFLFHKIWD